jgi:hypothetical protein
MHHVFPTKEGMICAMTVGEIRVSDVVLCSLVSGYSVDWAASKHFLTVPEAEKVVQEPLDIPVDTDPIWIMQVSNIRPLFTKELRLRYPTMMKVTLKRFETDESDTWWWHHALMAMMSYFDGDYTETELKELLADLDLEGDPAAHRGVQ